ncbi:MAG: hypothetical protein ABIH89_03840 [Elusimicrobiota bacterium]
MDTCITVLNPFNASFSNTEVFYAIHESFVNAPPYLTSTGEEGYINDYIEPDAGTSTQTYTYRVKYYDGNNNEPLDGYPKLHILNNSIEVSSSPFTMSYVSGDFKSGAIYTFSANTPAAGNGHTYFIETYDKNYEYADKKYGSGPAVYSLVSGYVYNIDGSSMPSVSMVLSGDDIDNYLTGSEGYYQFFIGTENYTVTPSSHAYYSFTPPSRNYNNTASNQTGHNYTRDNSAPALNWTGEVNYTNDGLDPEVVLSSNIYTFRVEYSDNENDPPDFSSGYPAVNIYKDSNLVKTLSMNYESGPYDAGAVFSISTSNFTPAVYTYDFTAKDVSGSSSTLSPSNGSVLDIRSYISGYVYDPNNDPMGSVAVTLSGAESDMRITGPDGYWEFFVTTAAYTVTPSSYAYYSFSPASIDFTGTLEHSYDNNFKRISGTTLIFTGTEGYYADCIEPGAGTTGNCSFSFSVKYVDTENDAPGNGYPKAHILKDGQPYRVSSMNYVSGDYLTGAIYSTSTFFSEYSKNYAYYIESYDVNGSSFILDNNFTFQVVSNPPVLSFTGESGYVNDCLNYDVATPTMTITFKVRYSDLDNDPPKDKYPKLNIYRDNSLYCAYIMEHVSGNYDTGAIYSVIASFPDLSENYSYDIAVYDKWDTSFDWNKTFSFTVFSRAPSMPEMVTNPDNPDFYDGCTAISSEIALCWRADEPDNERIIYTLYLSEPQNNKLSPAAAKNTGILYPVYTGIDPSYTVRNLTPGRLYLWQVKAEDIHGASAMSNIFSFSTLDLEDNQVFNYPNPFNPLEEYTTFVFKSGEIQTVKFYVYSEFADLVYQEDIEALPGTNSFRYDGRDNSGEALYNGSYIARLDKSDGEATCYILIIK